MSDDTVRASPLMFYIIIITIVIHDINPCLPCERRRQSRRMLFASEIVSRSTRQLFSLWLSAPSVLSHLPPSLYLPPYPTCIASVGILQVRCAHHCSFFLCRGESFAVSDLVLGTMLCNMVAHVMVLLLQVMHARQSSVPFTVKLSTVSGC